MPILFFVRVIGKGLIGRAAENAASSAECYEAARLVRPRGELNRNGIFGYGV